MKLFSSGRKRALTSVKDLPDVPAQIDESPTDTQSLTVRPLHGNQTSVVIVDDDDEVRFVLRVALEAAGFRVAADAGDAESALEEINRVRPDVVLLDLHMPDVGGLELLPLIYEDVPTTRVVVISAISATYMTEAALQEGAWGYIVKGVSARTIAEHLRHVTEKAATRPLRPYPLSKNYEDKHYLDA
ncbi:response regulator [Nocardioides yefusunii]|uniref:Response regulator transcription factor n=1 Tax=Nocardioides yefusunii TaxID=2500546 RepID=A0ABW1QWM0_9ACTN|nr:response regulator transcription factor [Nocardioides yefusunii]